MKSNATDVKSYLKEVPTQRLEALATIRKLCQEHLVGYEESMRYNMPSYSKNDVVEVGFASQKQYICLYIMKHDVMLDNQSLLAGLNHGKGCIRYSNPTKIDYDIIEKLLDETVKSDGSAC